MPGTIHLRKTIYRTLLEVPQYGGRMGHWVAGGVFRVSAVVVEPFGAFLPRGLWSLWDLITHVRAPVFLVTAATADAPPAAPPDHRTWPADALLRVASLEMSILYADVMVFLGAKPWTFPWLQVAGDSAVLAGLFLALAGTTPAAPPPTTAPPAAAGERCRFKLCGG